MRKYIFIASLIFFIVGCKKYDDKSDVPKDDKKVVPVEILKNGNMESKVVESLTNDKKEENVESKKTEEVPKNDKKVNFLDLAKTGNSEAILMSIKYYKDKNNVKEMEKYIDLGLKKNIDEVLKLKIVELLNKNMLDKAKVYIDKLNESPKKRDYLAIYYYKLAAKFSEKNDHQKASYNFSKAYENGMKSASLYTAYEYVKLRNIKNASKWFEIANSNGQKEANYELAVIAYNTGDFQKAIKHLKEQYARGNKEVAISIGVCYANIKNYDEANKWLNIAVKNGDAKAKRFIKEINNNREGSYNVE